MRRCQTWLVSDVLRGDCVATLLRYPPSLRRQHFEAKAEVLTALGISPDLGADATDAAAVVQAFVTKDVGRKPAKMQFKPFKRKTYKWQKFLYRQ